MLTNRFSIIVIEDDEPKLRAICGFFSNEFPSTEVRIAQSLTSAIDVLAKERFDMAVIDMSIPTYDFAVDRAGGGPPQGFGGEDILNFLESESPDTKSVILTQYEEFSAPTGDARMSLEDLDKKLRNDFGDSFLGVIRYAGQNSEWRATLKNKLIDLVGDKK